MAKLPKTFIRSSQVTKYGSLHMSLQQNNSTACGSLDPSQIKGKLFMEKSLRSKWRLVSSAKFVKWRLFPLSIVGRSILSGKPQFVCLKSSEKFEKRTREDEKTRRLTHRLKPAPLWPAKTSNWLVIRHIALTLHPMTSLYFRTSVDAVEAFKNHVLEGSQSEWKKCFDKCFEHMLMPENTLMINIRIFIIRSKLYRATLVLKGRIQAYRTEWLLIWCTVFNCDFMLTY